MSSESPEYSPFFAVMGASAAMVFSGNYHLSYIHAFNCVFAASPLLFIYLLLLHLLYHSQAALNCQPSVSLANVAVLISKLSF